MASIGSTPSLVVGVGVGAALSAALEPALEVPKQQAWANNAHRILDVDLLARLVAQGGIDLSAAAAEAARDGYAADKLDALVYLAQTVPGIGEALNLWRRGLISDALFTHVLVKEGLDQRYVDGITANKLAEPLGLGDIAYAVVRGILPAPSYVPVAPPTTSDKVPRYPQVDVDPEKLAALTGYDSEALEIMVGRSGLSMAPVMAAQAFFREIIGPNDFLLAIAEGDLRTEWAEAVQEVSRQILTAAEYAQLELRGFVDAPTRRQLTGRHGMTDADSDYLYDVLGRAPNIHAVTTGLARGGTYDGQPKTIPEPFLSAVERADIRPEWYDIEYANRYTYPSAFVLRTLAQSGELGDEAAVEQVLLEIGWPPRFAKTVATAWTAATGATGDKHVEKAETQLWTATHKAYVAHEISDATATTALTAAGVTAAAIPAVLATWQQESALVRKALSATQIKKAYTGQVDNPATGVAWTKADALARLADLGYSPDDAETFIAE